MFADVTWTEHRGIGRHPDAALDDDVAPRLGHADLTLTVERGDVMRSRQDRDSVTEEDVLLQMISPDDRLKRASLMTAV